MNTLSAALSVRLYASFAVPALLIVMGFQPVRGSVVEPVAATDSGLVEKLKEIQAHLSEIEEDKNFSVLFSAEEGPIWRMQRHFLSSQKAVHDAIRKLSKEQPLTWVDKDMFHNSLDEYRMNIEEMPANHQFKGAKAPGSRELKRLRKSLKKLAKESSTLEGFEAVEHVAVNKSSTASEAVEFALRHIERATVLLSNRTLTYVTSKGKKRGGHLKQALEELRTTVKGYVKNDGSRMIQLDQEGEPEVNQLSCFEDSLAEAAAQAKYYKQYTPIAFSKAHVERQERIRAILDLRSGFASDFLNVDELKRTRDADEE